MNPVSDPKFQVRIVAVGAVIKGDSPIRLILGAPVLGQRENIYLVESKLTNILDRGSQSPNRALSSEFLLVTLSSFRRPSMDR